MVDLDGMCFDSLQAIVISFLRKPKTKRQRMEEREVGGGWDRERGGREREREGGREREREGEREGGEREGLRERER